MKKKEFPTPFYYMRHGKTEDNLAGIISGGDRDVELAEEGRRASALLAEPFAALTGITRICCSPMRRAHETAMLLNRVALRPVYTLPGLHEWVVGACAGKSEKTYGPGLSDWSWDPPGGETRDQLKKIVHQSMIECFLPQSDGDAVSGETLIVAHAGVWWAITKCLDLKMEKIDNCALYKLTYHRGSWHKNQIA